ncbi:hypothetical protein Back2_06700 [Nocardioides baekrokdamisoli]|uniref:Uncharacterized protein n=1 Tax=Nocardioides baekrokdamisoli TaxID=1804624 RepID=A0A3G9IVP4_9ACTN|nr:hypothetical protein [Nocardioides baekrokdamisoli]BBH16383.1 hypothetical protein Back2_06700 [Nocardioides baekrokdamisoli]
MAIYPYPVPDVAESLALKPGFWRQHLIQGGVPLEREGREFRVRLVNGDTTPARFQRVLLGFDIPNLVVNGQTYAYAPRLPVAVAIWCFLPIALVTLGGFIPAVIGLLAAIGNLRLMRTNAPVSARALASLGLTLAATTIVLLIGSLLNHLVHR